MIYVEDNKLYKINEYSYYYYITPTNILSITLNEEKDNIWIRDDGFTRESPFPINAVGKMTKEQLKDYILDIVEIFLK